MASVGSITWQSEKDEFLKESEVSDVVTSLEEGGLNELEGEFSSKLKGEMKTGLSLDALNLDGRAPLNEVATEMVARLNVTMADVTALKGIAQGEGNRHRKDEADKWWTEVQKHYKELVADLKDKEATYNNRKNLEYEVTNSEGEKETRHHEKCSVNVSDDTLPTWGSKPSTNINGGSAVIEAFNEATKFYNSKYLAAKEYYKECSKLDTSIDKYGKSIPAGEEKPAGVQPGAKKKVENDLGGKLQKITYTNPDGSTVEITKTDGKIKEHRVKNRYGYITESVAYDKDGKVDHKNVYTYKKVGNHVYQTTQQQYKYTDGKFEEEPSSTTENYGYAYPNKNGNVTYSKDEPTENQVGTPKSVIGNGYNTDTGGKTSSGSGEFSEISKAQDEGKYVTNFDQMREKINNKDDFVLKKGSKLNYDGYGLDNKYRELEDDDYTYKYDEATKKYIEYDSSGKATGTKLNTEALLRESNSNGSYIVVDGKYTHADSSKDF